MINSYPNREAFGRWILGRSHFRGIGQCGRDVTVGKPRLTLARTLACCLALHVCQYRKTDATPTIEFTRIPPAAEGGRERMGTIAGRVSGARQGQRIVLYARSGPWWVQPRVEAPFHSNSARLNMERGSSSGIRVRCSPRRSGLPPARNDGCVPDCGRIGHRGQDCQG